MNLNYRVRVAKYTFSILYRLEVSEGNSNSINYCELTKHSKVESVNSSTKGWSASKIVLFPNSILVYAEKPSLANAAASIHIHQHTGDSEELSTNDYNQDS